MNKGKKIRSIEIHDKLNVLLSKYERVGEFIFPIVKEMPNEWNKKNIIGAANTLVRKYLFIAVAKAGIDKHVHFHMARHSFATAMARNNSDIGIIKQALGHSKATTTEAYIKQLTDDAVNDAVRGMF